MFGRYYRFRPHHYLIVLAIGIIGFVLCMHMKSAHAGTLDLDYTVSSVHTEAWARHALNQTNPGLGVEYHWNRTWAIMGGEYLNSYHSPTWYLAGVWTPLHLGRVHHWHLDAGLAAGLATGYGHATYASYARAPVVVGDLPGAVVPGAPPPVPPAGAPMGYVSLVHRYMRNPLSPLMAAGIVRIVTPSGIGLNLMIVPNQGPRSSGFVGFQISVPLA